MPSAAAELGLGSVLVAAQSKVDAALPPELRARTARLRERFLVDVPGWFQAPEPVPALGPLATALWDGRRIDIHYRRGDRLVRRRLDPLGLVLKGSTGTSSPSAHRPDGVRRSAVSRVRVVTVRDEPARAAADFDLATTWAAPGGRSTATCAATWGRPRGLRWYGGPAVAASRHALPEPSGRRPWTSAGPPGPDGRCAVTIHSESLEVAHDELLRVGRVPRGDRPARSACCESPRPVEALAAARICGRSASPAVEIPALAAHSR